MAAGSILTVLSNVPWGHVLDAAPKVADGATRLWSSVTGRKAIEPAEERVASAAPPGEAVASPIAEMQARTASLQTAVEQLKDEMQSATELIKALADQNTALVQRIELNRIRLVRHTIVSGGVAAALLAAVVFLLLRP